MCILKPYCNYFQYSTLTSPAQGPWKRNHKGSAQRGFIASLQAGVTQGYQAQVHQGWKWQRGASLCVLPFERQELPFLQQLCSPTRGCSWSLHLVVVASKRWLGSCRWYFCDRQACASATYLFKWVQKFSASWQLFFFPLLFYTNQLIC